jgi:hypothetical protein
MQFNMLLCVEREERKNWKREKKEKDERAAQKYGVKIRIRRTLRNYP